MAVQIKIPEMGESVRSGVIARWIKNEGEFVNRDDPVLELETDKITAEVPAPAAGVISHVAKAGESVEVGAVVGTIDENAKAPSGGKNVAAASAVAGSAGSPAKAQAASGGGGKGTSLPAPSESSAQAAGGNGTSGAAAARAGGAGAGVTGDARVTPLARKLADEHGVDTSTLLGTGAGGKVREQDVLAAVAARAARGASPPTPASPARAASAVASELTGGGALGSGGGVRREKLSALRQRLATRLVEAQHSAAMLTTFNEVDLSSVMALRAKYKEEFEKKHGVGLGFMSFFVKAATSALRAFPIVNSSIVQGEGGGLEVEHRDASHISVAVSTPKGLTVPVLRNTQDLSFAQIEAGIKSLATRAREGKLTLDDLQGGTFTITNGGIFGSLLSTPILNAPQSAILGMHAIKNRPVEHPEKPGEIALRPMMYLALSYDHRLLDGSDAVQFLVHIKNALEKPERLLIGL